ncbi:telomere length regulation protein-domain-containing protein [Cyathus striatus]|nr:telomere length regulation protein-domain-containing protein [Cyathus striatus]
MLVDEDAPIRHRLLEITEQFQNPIADLTTLLNLLTVPLEYLNLLPPQFKPYSKNRIYKTSLAILKYIPSIQRALLEHVLPTWDNILEEDGSFTLLEQFFAPDADIASVSGQVAISAFSTLMTTRLTKQGIRLLRSLVIRYPVEKLYAAISLRSDLDNTIKLSLWEDCVKTVLMVPAKVSNAVQGKTDYPLELEHGTYFTNICLRFEILVHSLSYKPPSESITLLSYLFSRLVNVGLFPSYPPVSRSQPSFFQSTMPMLESRFASRTDSDLYKLYWPYLLRNISSGHAIQSILHSLFSSTDKLKPPLKSDVSSRLCIRKISCLLNGLVGRLYPGDELWEYAINLVIKHDWDESRARIFVCWISGGCETGIVDLPVLASFLDAVVEAWSSTEHVKRSLLSYHHYVTSLLIITLSYIRSSEQTILAIAHSPNLIQGVSKYISHLDPSVRRCGMLTAEVVANFSGKTLNFKDWEGDDLDRQWARDLRKLIERRDVDADIAEKIQQNSDTDISVPEQAVEDLLISKKPSLSSHQESDSDDSVTGYTSRDSSRSVSPTPTDLDELEREPTLNVGIKKVSRPAYLVQLGQLLRGASKNEMDKPHEADEQEVALSCAEALIRKKRDYGTELEENAINLTYGLLSLQDNFDLPRFEERRQAALTALVACSPKQAAPVLIEEFFKSQYSVVQRFALLNALSMGARELASLPLPSRNLDLNRSSMELKDNSQMISVGSIDKHKLNVTKRTTLAREKHLRIRHIQTISEVSSAAISSSLVAKTISYIDVAAQFFIMPLVHRFWEFLRDEQMREELTIHLEQRQRYHSAGTGLILNPVVFAQYLRAVAILVHASQNAPEWLAIIAPNALELAVTSGTRPLSSTMNKIETDEAVEQWGKEASVLTSAFELALVVLDGCLDLDDGRLISLEHTALLLGAGDWAGKVFSLLDKGIQAQGAGGLHETKLKSVAAGVLLKVDELTSRWRRSMIDT